MKTIRVFLFSIIVSQASAQQLANTYWASYDQANQFNLFWHFDNNTLSFSADSIFYQPVSSFFENGNSFTIVDLNSATCSVTDTGHYSFSILNDTLRFSLVSDNCSSRFSYMISYYFVNLHTGIDDDAPGQPIAVFPNPFNNVLNVSGNGGLSQINLYDISGRILLRGQFRNSLQLNTAKFDQGIYFYELRWSNGKISKGKLVKS